MSAHRAKRRKCSGSVYLHVLASSVLVTVIGLAALAAVRIQTRSALRAQDCAEARNCAVSAVELGLLFVTQDPNWRDNWTNGFWLSDKHLGDATFTLEGIDPQDGDLTDSEYQPLILTGTGTKGIARHKTQVTLVAVIKPLEALNSCLHAAGTVTVVSGKSIAVSGAALSTNTTLDNAGTITGDAEAGTVAQTGTITGTLTVPADPKQMPEATVVSDYVGRATVIPYTGTIDKQVLSPGSNPWGTPDPNGMYFLDTHGQAVLIRNSRIHGTLIVDTGGNTLTLDNAVLLHPYRSDCPVLIVNGNAELKFRSGTLSLSESAQATNFNPFGASYEDVWDDDMLDEYPNEIRGLIHVTGALDLQDTARVVGVIICQGAVTCEGFNSITHDPDLYATPPEGYTCVERMTVSPGSWKQVVD